MFPRACCEPVDYLIIGHLTCDLVDGGKKLGGTAAYAALTARALGLKVGVVTSYGTDVSLEALEQIQIVNNPASQSTTFENANTPHGREQFLYHIAHPLDFGMVPETWQQAAIVHLAPVAQEMETAFTGYFSASMLVVTPQGWLRGRDEQGKVHPIEWQEASSVLSTAGAAVISTEDLDHDEARVEEMASYGKVLAVTEGARGSRVFWNGDVRRFRPPVIRAVDTTGAGDVYAAAFFIRYQQTNDPWEAGRFATHLAACSVTRAGLACIPTPDEIRGGLVEVF